jgi:putative beta-lysine N-acetyltransferase
MSQSAASIKANNLPAPNPNSVIMEASLAGKKVKLNLDYLNERITVINYHNEHIHLLVDFINNLALRDSFGKIIVVAREKDWQSFLAKGFILEGVNSYYYRGLPGYYLVKFLKKERSISSLLIEEDNILQDILQRPVDTLSFQPPTEYILRAAITEDIPQMVQLYERVFESYPSPITEPSYLYQMLNKNLFKLVVYGNKIVSAASAELDHEKRAAELTDCACLTEYRNQGLTSQLIYSLEQELIGLGFNNLYSIARARSRGINTVFSKLGYTYGGRLINNCTICGQFEDMNLWVKNVVEMNNE